MTTRRQIHPLPDATGPRNIRKRKLDEPRVSAALKKWLFCDNLAYAVIQSKLLAEFGVRASKHIICNFWQRNSQPEESASTSVITIQLSVLAQGPVEVRVLNQSGGGK